MSATCNFIFQSLKSYEICVAWNQVTPSFMLFINGIVMINMTAATLSSALGQPSNIFFQTANNVFHNISNLMVFSTQIYTAAYIPGFAAISDVKAPQVSLVNTALPSMVATAAVDTSGNFVLTPAVNLGSVTTPANIMGSRVIQASESLRGSSCQVIDNNTSASWRLGGQYTFIPYYSNATFGAARGVITAPVTLDNGAIKIGTFGKVVYPIDAGVAPGTSMAFRFQVSADTLGLTDYTWVQVGLDASNFVAIGLHGTYGVDIYQKNAGNSHTHASNINPRPTAGVYYEIEHDFTAANMYTYFNGLLIDTYANDWGAEPAYTSVQLGDGFGTTNYHIKNVLVFPTAQHTGTSYSLGYTAVPDVVAPTADITTDVRVHSPTSYDRYGRLTQGATLGVNCAPGINITGRAVGSALVVLDEDLQSKKFGASFDLVTTAEISDATDNGLMTLVSGSADVRINGLSIGTAGAVSVATWILGGLGDPGNVGTVRMKFQPDHTTPLGNEALFILGDVVTTTANVVYLRWLSGTRTLQLGARNSINTLFSVNFNQTFEANSEYEIMVGWNLTTPLVQCFIDGILCAQITTTTGSRVNGTILAVQQYSGDTATIRDIAIYDIQLYTKSYYPGYSAFTALTAPVFRNYSKDSTDMYSDFTTDVSGNLTVQANLGTSNVVISAAEVHLANTVYENFSVMAHLVRPDTAGPTMAAFTSPAIVLVPIQLLSFANGTLQSVYFSFTMPRCWARASTITPSIRISQKTGTTGAASVTAWALEWTITDVGSQFLDNSFGSEDSFAVGDTDTNDTEHSWTPVNLGTSIATPGAVVMGALSRHGQGTDTFAHPLFLTAFNFKIGYNVLGGLST